MLQLLSPTTLPSQGGEKPITGPAPRRANETAWRRVTKSSKPSVSRGIPNNSVPFQTYRLSCRRKSPKVSQLLTWVIFVPFALPWWYGISFRQAVSKTVMNRRSKIIKGPLSAGSLFLDFLCTVLLLIVTYQFPRASYLRNIVAQFIYFYSLNALISK